MAVRATSRSFTRIRPISTPLLRPSRRSQVQRQSPLTPRRTTCTSSSPNAVPLLRHLRARQQKKEGVDVVLKVRSSLDGLLSLSRQRIETPTQLPSLIGRG